MHVINEVPIRPNRGCRVDEMEFRVPTLHLAEIADEIVLPTISEYSGARVCESGIMTKSIETPAVSRAVTIRSKYSA